MIHEEFDLLRALRSSRIGEGTARVRKVRKDDLSFFDFRVSISGKRSYLKTPYGQEVRLKNHSEQILFAEDLFGVEVLSLHRGAICGGYDTDRITIYDLCSLQCLFEQDHQAKDDVRDIFSPHFDLLHRWVNRANRVIEKSFLGPWDNKPMFDKSENDPVKLQEQFEEWFEKYYPHNPFNDLFHGRRLRARQELALQEYKYTAAWGLAKKVEAKVGILPTKRKYIPLGQVINALSAAQRASLIALGSLAHITFNEALSFIRGEIGTHVLVAYVRERLSRGVSQSMPMPHGSPGVDAMRALLEENSIPWPGPTGDDLEMYFLWHNEEKSPAFVEMLKETVADTDRLQMVFDLMNADLYPEYDNSHFEKLDSVLPACSVTWDSFSFESTLFHFAEMVERASDDELRKKLSYSADGEMLELGEKKSLAKGYFRRAYPEKESFWRNLERSLSTVSEYLRVFDKERSDLIAILKEGEGYRVEFKYSIRYDINKKEINRSLFPQVIKTITAFLNAEGGSVFLGVSDDGEPVGIDFEREQFRNLDKAIIYINQQVGEKLGNAVFSLVRLKDHNLTGNPIIEIECSRSPQLVAFGDEIHKRVRGQNRKLTPKQVAEEMETRRRINNLVPEPMDKDA